MASTVLRWRSDLFSLALSIALILGAGCGDESGRPGDDGPSGGEDTAAGDDDVGTGAEDVSSDGGESDSGASDVGECSTGDECDSGVCREGECVAPSCTDEVQNQDETDVDCGGETCDACATGKSCQDDGDCSSGICDGADGTTCANCREDETRTKECGYQQRGELTQTCTDGDWKTTTKCSGVWFKSCKEIQMVKPGAGDGTYTIDPDGPETGESPFDVQCNMTKDGGGWTLVATFRNDDEQRWSGTDTPDFWRNKQTIGTLANATSGDFKSKSFWTVDSNDVLLTEDTGNWMSFDDAITKATLYDMLQSITTCQTGEKSGVTIDSNVTLAKDHGFFTYYGADPNEGDTCAFNANDTGDNDSAVVTVGGHGCGSSGPGQIQRDFQYCLDSPSTTPPGSCGDWYSGDRLIFGGECNYTQLWIR